MHLAFFLGEYPITAQASFSFLKMGMGIFFYVSNTIRTAVLTVFETLKNNDFSLGGFPL